MTSSRYGKWIVHSSMAFSNDRTTDSPSNTVEMKSQLIVIGLNCWFLNLVLGDCRLFSTGQKRLW